MIPELPALPSPSMAAARPSRPKLEDLSFTNARAQAAAKLANDMRAAFFHSKIANKRSKAIAKAKGRQAQRIAERR